MPETIEIPTQPFLSAEPKVTLVNAFSRPFDNAVATARTCYSSKGIVTAEQVAGEGLDEALREDRRQKRDDLARSIYKAGHHTTLQHAHFQFALENVSRQFIWSPVLAGVYYLLQRYGDAIDAGSEGHSLMPDYVAPLRYVVAAMGQLGQLDQVEPLSRKV